MDHSFAGSTIEIKAVTPDEVKAWQLLDRVFPVRPEGWTCYLCVPANDITAQLTT